MKLHNNQIQNERAGKASFVFWLGVCAILVGVDQLTKYLAFHGSFGSFLNVLKPAIRKFHYFNHGFAFSLPLPPALMYALYAVILFFIFLYLYKNYFKLNLSAKIAWTMILAGAASNIAERVALGYVRDFIYIFSGIFNLADGYIIAGVVILLITSLNKNQEPGHKYQTNIKS